MTEVLNGDHTALGLVAPTRNRYFYGKLLDVFHLTMEQAYGNRKRWLVNRTVLGSGVVCGLEPALTEEGLVQFGPGLAIDYHGREIVVPAATPVLDPRQPTDDCGRPYGDPVSAGWVEVSLAYHECEAEHVPAPACDCGCDGEPGCQASMIRERYRLLVEPVTPGEYGGPRCSHPGLWLDDRTGGLRLSQEELIRLVSQPCEEVSGDGRIPLVRVQIDPEAEPSGIGLFPHRAVVFHHAAMMEALICLAARVPVVQTDLPQVIGTSWRHADEVALDEFLNGLEISFSHPIQQPDGAVEGWFQVTLEWPEQGNGTAIGGLRLVRRVGADRVRFAEDQSTVVFEPDPRLADSLPPQIDRALCRVVLKSHVITDHDNRPLDGDFLRGQFPTGDGVPGGDFDSWFILTVGQAE